ncbi:hypothetical protein NFI96_010730 [Prochilodus magdalenae]|nr:hypothetical protein NFI96_010730 [Prochilodus magdalenae]
MDYSLDLYTYRVSCMANSSCCTCCAHCDFLFVVLADSDSRNAAAVDSAVPHVARHECKYIVTHCVYAGAASFMIHSAAEGRCLEDSDEGVQLRRCGVDSVLQQWVWTEEWFLMNVGTERCLSPFHNNPVQTVDCASEHLQWDCRKRRLISVNRSLELATDGGVLTLTNRGKNTAWRSLDDADFCQEKLRSRRQSEPNEFEIPEDDRPQMGPSLTPEQREYLKWYYRSEDPTPWVFGMLIFSFVGLLLGCVFLVMGMMGNRSRKKIAKYKAAAAATPPAKPEMEELQVITHDKEDMNSHTAPTQDNHKDNTDNKAVPSPQHHQVRTSPLIEATSCRRRGEAVRRSNRTPASPPEWGVVGKRVWCPILLWQATVLCRSKAMESSWEVIFEIGVLLA